MKINNTADHLEELRRPPGSRVIYSAGCQIILVLLTVHSLVDRLRRKDTVFLT